MSSAYNLRKRTNDNFVLKNGRKKRPRSQSPAIEKIQQKSEETSCMENFPVEILQRIFGYLTEVDKIRCEAVCKRWAKILGAVWREVNGIYLNNHSFKLAFLKDGKIVQRNMWNNELPGLSKFFAYCINRIGSNLKEIQLYKLVFHDSSSIDLVIKKCRNLEILILKGIQFYLPPVVSENRKSLFLKLITMKRLKQLVINDCGMKDFKVTNSTVRKLQSNLTHLSLVNLLDVFEKINFAVLCRLLGPTLESFCCKGNSFDPRYLSEGFQYLAKLRHLNLSPISFHDQRYMCNNQVLISIASYCRSLETLNLKGNRGITARGLKALFLPIRGLEKLRILNVEKCTYVDDKIRNVLESRSDGAPTLKIFAYGSNISAALANPFVEHNDKWQIVVDQKSEMIDFYGEAKIPFGGEFADDDYPDSVSVYSVYSDGLAGSDDDHYYDDGSFESDDELLGFDMDDDFPWLYDP